MMRIPPALLLLAALLSWPATGQARNDYSPRIRDFLDISARLRARQEAKRSFIKTVVRSQGDKVSSRSFQLPGGVVLGGPKVKLRLELVDVQRKSYPSRLFPRKTFRAVATYNGKTYEQYFSHGPRRGVNDVVLGWQVQPIAHDATGTTLSSRTKAFSAKQPWTRVK